MSDTGIGINEDQLERIFEPFRQVADPARGASGTGLGLTISRRLVERMGGKLQVGRVVQRTLVGLVDLTYRTHSSSGSIIAARSA